MCVNRRISKRLMVCSWTPNARLLLSLNMHQNSFCRPHIYWLCLVQSYYIIYLCYNTWHPLQNAKSSSSMSRNRPICKINEHHVVACSSDFSSIFIRTRIIWVLYHHHRVLRNHNVNSKQVLIGMIIHHSSIKSTYKCSWRLCFHILSTTSYDITICYEAILLNMMVCNLV